ncbi:hypothetical protein [Dyella caseinilytica]|uniref:Uncharacterized protein n=1 Tax=Dyella caseinilytica TaxID=1849581 RepID=A0ABX7GW93_9GAMM|nr:hypothetical protein [Dyella caseinilytica]QRN54743.1 hypothetical protein ISN74_05150 [Dyella caseinilytica]GFZ96565.1 hypothetical protein GCM10011408_16160 [Dyella caseinilytica]
MNKLQLRAARPRTASTFHRRKASRGISRLRHVLSAVTLHHDVPVRHSTPLRAQWSRNPVSGALECRWIVDATMEPPMYRGSVHRHPVIRMPRRTSHAGMRPPSR